MGVKGWSIFKPKSISLQKLKGSIVGIDAYYIIKRYGSREIGTLKYSIISGILYFVLNLLEREIVPIFIYDGILPTKNRSFHERKYYMNTKNIDMYRMNKTLENLDFDFDNIISLTRELLTALGIQHIMASEEADKLLAGLSIQKKIDYVFSTDRDYLAYGVPHLITRIDFENNSADIICLNDLLQTYELTLNQLRDLAIICGNDYYNGISGIGVKKGISLLRKYKDLWGVLDYLKINPEISMIKARKNYENIESYKISIMQIYPNLNLIHKILINIIGEKRSENAILRLRKIFNKIRIEQQVLA